MRKKLNIIYVLSALILSACSSDDAFEKVTPNSKRTTYTLTAAMPEMTRVSYTDGTNGSGTSMLFCKWEENDIVTLKEISSAKTYDFTVIEVNGNGVATISYTGEAIENADNFQGTATYAPRDAEKANVQTSATSTEHLKYGETMTAAVSGKLNGATLSFAHGETAVYKVTFIAPHAIAKGSTLTMSGAWGEEKPTVTLDFTADETAKITAYIIAGAGSLASNKELTFSLDIEGDEIYEYSFKNTKNTAVEYTAGKYWLANISSQTLTQTTVNRQKYVDNGNDTGTLGIHKWVFLGNLLSDLDKNITPGSKADRRIVFGTENVGATEDNLRGLVFRFGEGDGWKIGIGSGLDYSKIRRYHINPETNELTENTPYGTNYSDQTNYGKESADAPYKYCFARWFPSCGVYLWNIKGMSDFVDTEYGEKHIYDAATYNWGAAWHMIDDYRIFTRNYLTREWTTESGTSGMKYTSGKTGKEIFLPKSGPTVNADLENSIFNEPSGKSFYWTSEPYFTHEQWVAAGKPVGIPKKSDGETSDFDEYDKRIRKAYLITFSSEAYYNGCDIDWISNFGCIRPIAEIPMVVSKAEAAGDNTLPGFVETGSMW